MNRKPLMFVPSEEIDNKYSVNDELLSKYGTGASLFFNGLNTKLDTRSDINPTKVEYTHSVTGKRYEGWSLNGDPDSIHQVRCRLQEFAEQEYAHRLNTDTSIRGNGSFNASTSWVNQQMQNYNIGNRNYYNNYGNGLYNMLYSPSINTIPSIGTDVDITIKGWFKTKIQKVFSLYLERKFKSLVLTDIPNMEFKGLKRSELKLSKYE